MKTITFFLCLISLTAYQSASAQSDLSLQMGIHHGSRIYETGRGIHLGLEYRFPAAGAMGYGVAMHSSRFNSDLKKDALTHINSLTGFAAFRLVTFGWVQPYIKFEVGAAHNQIRGELADEVVYAQSGDLEQRASFDEVKANRFSAQLAPAIGGKINLTESFGLRMEYRHTMHYGNQLVSSGRFNYGSVDLGLNYMIGRASANCRKGCPVW